MFSGNHKLQLGTSPLAAWRRSASLFAGLPEFRSIDANEPDAPAAKLKGIAINGSRLAGKRLSGPSLQVDSRGDHCGE